jgi:hypothetical protein
MSRPRPVIAGCSYLITRRCTQRTLLMRPDAETNNAFIYCLAYAAERCGIEVLFTVATIITRGYTTVMGGTLSF